MYITRFVRRDRRPDEEYYCPTIEEARYHLEQFRDDDSELYERIEIVSDDEPEKAVETLTFKK